MGAPLGIYSSHIERLTHFRLWWLLLLVVLAIHFTRRRRIAIVLLTLAIAAWSAWPLLPYWSSHRHAEDSTPPLRVIAWNLLWENPHKAEALAWLQFQDADLILLTECTLEWQRALAPLQDRYPHRIHSGRDGAEGMWLLSRFPLDPPDPEGIAANKPWISTIVHSTAGPIRVLGMHPRTPRSGARFDERNAQYDRAAAVASAADIPVLLMGDLNCTPFSPWFARLLQRGNLSDTAWGFGLTGTWQGQGVRLPIDHILVNNRFHVIERHVELDFHGSDHRPVTAILSIQSAP